VSKARSGSGSAAFGAHDDHDSPEVDHIVAPSSILTFDMSVQAPERVESENEHLTVTHAVEEVDTLLDRTVGRKGSVISTAVAGAGLGLVVGDVLGLIVGGALGGLVGAVGLGKSTPTH
jgi:hypothetical protein